MNDIEEDEEVRKKGEEKRGDYRGVNNREFEGRRRGEERREKGRGKEGRREGETTKCQKSAEKIFKAKLTELRRRRKRD